MTETTPPPPATGPSGPTPGPVRAPTTPFARSSSDRVLGGVAGALATRLAVDPVLVRVVLVVVAIATGGFVVPLYLLTWAVVARDDDRAPRLYRYVAVRDGGVWMWIAVVVLGLLVLDGLTDPFDGPVGFPLLPLALIGVGVALWTRGDRASRTPPIEGAPPPPLATGAPAAAGTMPAGATTPDGAQGASTPPWPPRPTPVTGPPAPPPGRRPREPRERSVLGVVTIALALIVAGIAAAIDASTAVAVDLGVTGVSAIALLVLGIGLVVGSVWGRARWLLLVALLLMPVVGVGVLAREADRALGIDVGVASGVGERSVTLVGDDELPSSLALLAGSVAVDLERWSPDEEALDALDGDGPDLEIEVGAGEVDVDLPSDVRWRVTTEVGLGEYRVRGGDERVDEQVDGLVLFGEDGERGAPERFVLTGGPDDGPVLDVTIDVAAGQVTLHEHSPTPDAPAAGDDDTGDGGGADADAPTTDDGADAATVTTEQELL